MIITSNQIRNEIKNRWPGCLVIATDINFQTIDLASLITEFKKIHSEIGPYRENVYECEDICKVFIGRIVEAQVKRSSEGPQHSWPIGIALIEGRRGPHYLILARTDDAWIFYEPQSNRIEPEHKPLFLFI